MEVHRQGHCKVSIPGSDLQRWQAGGGVIPPEPPIGRTTCMASRRWLRGQSDVMVSLSAPRPLTTLGTSRSTGAFEEVRRVYEDFATALIGGAPLTCRPAATANGSPRAR